MSVSFFQAAVTRCKGSLKSLRGGFKLVVRRLAAYRLPAGLIFVLDFRLPLLYAVGSLKPKWNGALYKTVFASGQMCPKSCVFSALLLRLFFRLPLHHAKAAENYLRSISGVSTRTSAFCARWRSAWSISTSASMASAMGAARSPTQGSCRPWVARVTGLP